jgi:hypothetical protein
VPEYGYYVFPNPSVPGFPTAADPAIEAVGNSFSPLPCQAWHGYGVTITHRVEVEVGADGPASAPLSGVAAAAPPAGADLSVLDVKILISNCIFQIRLERSMLWSRNGGAWLDLLRQACH